GRGMDLHCRLRREPHAGAAPDADDLLQAIVAECTGSRRGNNHVQPLALGKPSTDAEWRLGVGLGQHGAAVAVDKSELEAGMPPDQREWPLVATTHRGPQKSEFRRYALTGRSQSRSRRIHVTTFSSPAPLLRFVNTNGRSPRITRASRAMTS